MNFTGTIFNGMVVSAVSAGEKGVGLKVMCKELQDTYRVYIPADRVKGEQLLKLGDSVDIHYNKLFPSGSEIRMDAQNIMLNSSKQK